MLYKLLYKIIAAQQNLSNLSFILYQKFHAIFEFIIKEVLQKLYTIVE